MCTGWKQYRFKTQLHIGFSLFNFVVLAAIFIAVFTFTYVITAKSESHLRDRLAKASEGYTSAIAADSSAVFDQLLDRVAKNFLNIIAFTAAEYKLTSTVFVPQPSYYEWIDTLPQPAAYNPRYNSTVSFEDGGYSVSRRAASDRYSFSSTLNNTIDLTQPSMVRMKNLFELNPEFIGGYYCVGSEAVLGSQHLFREYPAASNGNKAQLLAYDCAQDDWYASGVAAAGYASLANPSTKRAATYTSAYIDPWIHQAMITIAMPMFDPESNDFLGVAGADLLTTSIQASIEGIRYLAHGRAVLFEVSAATPTVGVVIADTARSVATQQTKLQSYPSLRNPSIDSASWANMFKPDTKSYFGTFPALATFVEVDDAGTKWWVASKGLKQGSGNYMLSIMVLQSDVTSVLDPVLSSISSARRSAIIVVCIVCGVVLLLAAMVTLVLAHRIVDPISKLTLDSQRIIDRIGHSNMLKASGAAGVEGAVADSSISETRQLQQAHRKMIENIEAAQREQNAAAAAQQVAGRIDYALPAFDPAGNFDQNFVPGAPNNASALPAGILLDASSLPASPALPVGVLLHFDPADQLHPPQPSQTQQQGVQLVNMSPYGVSASTSLPASASNAYNNNTPVSPYQPRQSQPYASSTTGEEGKQPH